jgi:hypothetical protein
VINDDGLRFRNANIHLAHPIKGDTWHMIQEIMISRLIGLSMDHNVSSQNLKSQCTLKLGS